MSNRDLANVAIIVWGIAVLLGVFVGAPLLLGMQIDVGLIVNALAAAGVFSAAVAAVLRGHKRPGSTQERARQSRQSASRLVRIQLGWQSLGGREAFKQRAYAQVIVNNWGTLPIVDVKATRWEWEGHRAEFRNEPTQLDAVMPSPVASGDRAGVLKLYPTDDATKTAMAAPTITQDTNLTVTIEFTDANGMTWKRTASTPPLRQTQLVGNFDAGH
jgi:hypothetical protein